MSDSPRVMPDRIREICDLTGLEYCGPECGCRDGAEECDDPGQLVFPYPGEREVQEWVPDWMNCVSIEEVDAWLVEHKYLEAEAAEEKTP